MKRRAALGGLGAALAVYLGLPYLLVQRLNLGLVRQGSWKHYDLALTFDDGPDPATTPAVLDALKAAGAHATFFVLVERGETHPELIRRMRREGHQIELHAVHHRHGWLRAPWSAFLEPRLGAERLQRLTGERPHFHRPPHGAYTLATVLGQRRAGLVGAHWDVEGRDWHPDFTPERVTQRVLAQAHPGAVIVLHDAGPGAATTVQALPELLHTLAERGYTFHTLAALPGLRPLGRATLPRRLSGLLDQLYDRLGHLQPVIGRADTALRVGVVRLPAGPFTLRSGRVIEKGARVLELHANSPYMVDFGVKRSMRRAIAWDLPWLAEEILGRPEWRRAEGVYTLGSLSTLAAMFGLENHPVSPADARRLTRWANLLRLAYGTPPTAPVAKLSLIDMDSFLARYAGKGKDQAEGGPAPRMARSFLASDP